MRYPVPPFYIDGASALSLSISLSPAFESKFIEFVKFRNAFCHDKRARANIMHFVIFPGGVFFRRLYQKYGASESDRVEIRAQSRGEYFLREETITRAGGDGAR